MTTADFLTIDLPAMLVAVFAATSCGLLGNFLVLRRQALIGDAISHVVLPGIVAGFLVAGTISTLPLMLGAMAAAILAAGLIELFQRAGRLDSGAAMGVVFTTMFAGGIVLLEQSGAANVHLDAEHALYGNLESTLWLGVTDWSDLTSIVALAELPRTLVTLAAVTAFVVVLVVLFFKELQVTTFDAGLAASLGLPVRVISVSLIVVVAVAAVAAFEAVGSILVIAMFICPAATARLLTDNLARQLWISAAVAAVAGIGGYLAAAFGPVLLGGTNSLSAAGMIAVAAGALQTLAILFAPRYGVVSQSRQRAARRLDLAGGKVLQNAHVGAPRRPGGRRAHGGSSRRGGALGRRDRGAVGRRAGRGGMIDFYYWPTPNGWKISIMLEECGLEYRTIPVNISRGEQFAPEFLAISPNNRMPAIVDHDDPDGPMPVFESGAILLHLAERTGRFMPTDRVGRKETLEWLFWQVGNLGPMAGQHSHYWNYAEGDHPYPAKRYANEYNRCIGVLERRLEGRDWIVGDAYSIADMASFPWVLIAKAMGQALDDFPNVARWRAAVKDRPAVQRGVDLGKELRRTAKPTDEERELLYNQSAASTAALADRAAKN